MISGSNLNRITQFYLQLMQKEVNPYLSGFKNKLKDRQTDTKKMREGIFSKNIWRAIATK